MDFISSSLTIVTTILSGGPASVIAILLLVIIGIVVACYYLLKKEASANRSLQERNDKLEGKLEDKFDGIVTRYENSQISATHAMSKVGEALTELKNEIRFNGRR